MSENPIKIDTTQKKNSTAQEDVLSQVAVKHNVLHAYCDSSGNLHIHGMNKKTARYFDAIYDTNGLFKGKTDFFSYDFINQKPYNQIF